MANAVYNVRMSDQEKSEQPRSPSDKTLIRKPAFSFPDWTGKDLGEFIVEKLIGEGGMAVVYQGAQKTLQRKVAIKVLPATLSQHQQFQQLFMQEARVLANLSHPNIVPIYSYGQFENCSYFAMELIRGETLRQKIESRKSSFFKRRTLFPVSDILRWVRQMAGALEYAHNRGVIHRDIKPANILMDEHERIFISDFGLVRVMQISMAEEVPGGTPGYMSYEQALGREVDGRTDIYSLGCVMYELLTGKAPSEAQTVAEAVAVFEKGEIAPPVSLIPTIPLLLDQIIMKALEKDRKDRYQTMGEFMAVLDQFSSGKLQAKLDPRFQVRTQKLKRTGPKKGSKLLRIAVLLTLLGTLAFVAGKPWLKQWQTSKEQSAESWCNSQMHIAQNYRKNRMNTLAAQTYRKIIDRYPKHPAADKAREELKQLEDIS